MIALGLGTRGGRASDPAARDHPKPSEYGLAAGRATENAPEPEEFYGCRTRRNPLRLRACRELPEPGSFRGRFRPLAAARRPRPPAGRRAGRPGPGSAGRRTSSAGPGRCAGSGSRTSGTAPRRGRRRAAPPRTRRARRGDCGTCAWRPLPAHSGSADAPPAWPGAPAPRLRAESPVPRRARRSRRRPCAAPGRIAHSPPPPESPTD